MKRFSAWLSDRASTYAQDPHEDYLSAAADLADLEVRQRELAHRKESLLPHDYFARG